MKKDEVLLEAERRMFVSVTDDEKLGSGSHVYEACNHPYGYAGSFPEKLLSGLSSEIQKAFRLPTQKYDMHTFAAACGCTANERDYTCPFHNTELEEAARILVGVARRAVLDQIAEDRPFLVETTSGWLGHFFPLREEKGEWIAIVKRSDGLFTIHREAKSLPWYY